MPDPNVYLASLFNVSGLAVVAVASGYVQHRFPRVWFRYWTLAYILGFASLALETFALGYGRSLPLSLLEIGLLSLDVVYLWQTLQTLRGRPLTARRALGLATLGAAAGALALLGGVPFNAVMAVPMLLLSLGFVALGVVLWRGAALSPAQAWLAGPLLLLGLLPVTYPFTHDTPQAWLGFWAGGVLNLIVGMGMVISAMEAAARDLQAANEQLRRHDSLKTNIFNNLSHEIRTPLTAIRAAAVAMERGPAQGSDFSGLIGDQVARLDRMLSDVLDAAQLDAGTLTYEFDEIDVAEVVESACRMFGPLCAEARQTLSCDVPEEALSVTGDRHRLMQVVSNLLENARKFTPRDGHIWARAQAVPGGVRIEVSDDGPGVPQALRETIFEKFFQADGGSTRRVGGTGLGLAICRAIVADGHGGRIWVAERPGGGCAITVELAHAPRPHGAASGPSSPVALPG